MFLMINIDHFWPLVWLLVIVRAVNMVKILHMHANCAHFHTIPSPFNSPTSAPASYFQDYTNKVRKFLSNKQSYSVKKLN